MEYNQIVSNDPLRINQYLNLLTTILGVFYILLSARLVAGKAGVSMLRFISLKTPPYRSLRNLIIHILAIIIVFTAVKVFLKGNIGDYIIISYISLFILLNAFTIINQSSYFDQSGSFLDIPLPKYRKSTLSEDDKTKILTLIKKQFHDEGFHLNNLASLTELSRRTGISQHSLSQVINEKMNLSFFEILAEHRIEEAKKIFLNDKSGKLTIEEVSERVGYNSKTSFNNAFRKLTGLTPSDFRKTFKS
jgi:AraC-like DNA-binding protein